MLLVPRPTLKHVIDVIGLEKPRQKEENVSAKKDYSLGVLELRAAYRAVKEDDGAIRARVKAKYADLIEDEIQAEKRANHLKFARHLASVKERDGIPVSVIQDEVLRTRSWNRWLYWRDLGNIPDEFTQKENMREAAREAKKASLPYRIIRGEDGLPTGIIELFKTASGEEVEPILLRVDTNWVVLTLNFVSATDDWDRVMEHFNGGVDHPDGFSKVKSFVLDALHDSGDYDEMLAWAKAVKK